MSRYHFFYTSSSPFSQWYACDFTVTGLRYCCAEQFMMVGKAKLFGDEQMAKRILGAKSPRTQKALGRKVHGFDDKIWKRKREQIVYRGNRAKFLQNADLMAELLATAGAELVEASPRDRIWGIGLSAEHPDASNKSKWRGQNLLGTILTRLRDEFLAEGVVDESAKV